MKTELAEVEWQIADMIAALQVGLTHCALPLATQPTPSTQTRATGAHYKHNHLLNTQHTAKYHSPAHHTLNAHTASFHTQATRHNRRTNNIERPEPGVTAA